MTTTDTITLIGVIVNAGILLIYAFTLNAIKRQVAVTEKAATQALNASFLQLFPIVERHHSPQIAEFRRFARDELPAKCAGARAAGMSLKEFDPKASIIASDIANYYESIGMLVEHGEKNLLSDVESMLLDMIRASAHEIWEIFFDNIDVIHPGKLGTWAGSFEYLYQRIGKYDPSRLATKPKLIRG